MAINITQVLTLDMWTEEGFGVSYFVGFVLRLLFNNNNNKNNNINSNNKAVILNICPIVRKFLAQKRIRSAWSVRPVLL
jgi:hypothetical protein